MGSSCSSEPKLQPSLHVQGVHEIPEVKGEILSSPNSESFCLSELREATANFDCDRILGGGNFGIVYKGWIKHGYVIAVKRLAQNGCLGQQEWLVEIKCALLRHPNLVKLIGYCMEDDERLLVYEYVPGGSLEYHLFRSDSNFTPPTWNLRMKIALGAARALEFLHEEADVIYRGLKISGVLLDLNYNAKLTDFGLARDGPVVGSYVCSRIVGAELYLAPEYSNTGRLTKKCDVYSFGVVFLEMLSGRRVVDCIEEHSEQPQYLVRWARPHLRRKNFKVLDVRMAGQYGSSDVVQALDLAYKCLSVDPKLRPNMKAVVKVLEQLYDSKDD